MPGATGLEAPPRLADAGADFAALETFLFLAWKRFLHAGADAGADFAGADAGADVFVPGLETFFARGPGILFCLETKGEEWRTVLEPDRRYTQKPNVVGALASAFPCPFLCLFLFFFSGGSFAAAPISSPGKDFAP